jgi:hypothetical protein
MLISMPFVAVARLRFPREPWLRVKKRIEPNRRALPRLCPFLNIPKKDIKNLIKSYVPLVFLSLPR